MVIKNKQSSNRHNIVSFTRNAEFYFNRAMQAYDKGNLRRVQELLLTAVKLKPEDVWNHFNLALTLEEMGKYVEAIQIWKNKVLALDDMLAEAYFHLALCYAETGRVDLTSQYLKHYLDIDPDGELESVARQILLAITDAQDQTTQLDNIDKKDILKIQQIEKQVTLLLSKNAYTQAAALYDQLIEAIGPKVFILNKAAILHFMAKNAQKGLSYCQLVLEQDNHNVEAHCNMIFYYHEVRNEIKVQALIEDMEETSFLALQDVTRWAYALSVIGKNRRAYDLLRDVYWEGEINVEMLNMLALNALHLGKIAAAKDYWKQAVCLSHEAIAAHLYLALLDEIKDISAILQIAEYQNQWPMMRLIMTYQSDKSFSQFNEQEQKVLLFCINWFMNSKVKALIRFSLDLLEVIPKQEAVNYFQQFLLSEYDDLKYNAMKQHYHLVKDCTVLRTGVFYINLAFTCDHEVTDAQQSVAKQIELSLSHYESELYAQIGMAIWQAFCQRMVNRSIIIRKPEVWSAAVEEIVLQCFSFSYLKKEIIEKHGVSYASAKRARDKILEAFKVRSQV